MKRQPLQGNRLSRPITPIFPAPFFPSVPRQRILSLSKDPLSLDGRGLG